MSRGPVILWLLRELWWLYLTPAAAQTVVTGYVGQTVTLPCTYASWSQGSHSMCWGKGSCPKSKCNEELLHTDERRVLSRKSAKYQLRGNIWRGDVSLTIFNTNEGDSAVYCCRIEVPGWFNDVKKNIVLRLMRESKTSLLPEVTSEDSSLFTPKGKIDSSSPFSFPAPETTSLVENEVEPEQLKEVDSSFLAKIIAPSLGFVLVALIVALLLRGKVMKTNCFQKHTRLHDVGESKNVLDDPQHGREDEDGLFTL